MPFLSPRPTASVYGPLKHVTNAAVTTTFDFDSTAARQAFDCLSKVIKISVT